MTESEVKLSEYKRTVVCECGGELDLRTQGLLCARCRARSRSERKRNMAAAWERFFQRQEPSHTDRPSADVGALVDAIDRLVDALESDRTRRGRQTWPSTSLALPSRRTAEPRNTSGAGRMGGIPLDRLELE